MQNLGKRLGWTSLYRKQGHFLLFVPVSAVFQPPGKEKKKKSLRGICWVPLSHSNRLSSLSSSLNPNQPSEASQPHSDHHSNGGEFFGFSHFHCRLSLHPLHQHSGSDLPPWNPGDSRKYRSITDYLALSTLQDFKYNLFSSFISISGLVIRFLHFLFCPSDFLCFCGKWKDEFAWKCHSVLGWFSILGHSCV